MMRPVIPNFGTTTYEIANHFNKLLTPLNKSDYNILNTEDLSRRLREEIIPAEEQKLTKLSIKFS